MKIDPSNFTYELLSSLKFKELQKLSVQYRVNKRWAKKVNTLVPEWIFKFDISKILSKLLIFYTLIEINETI